MIIWSVGLFRTRFGCLVTCHQLSRFGCSVIIDSEDHSTSIAAKKQQFSEVYILTVGCTWTGGVRNTKMCEWTLFLSHVYSLFFTCKIWTWSSALSLIKNSTVWFLLFYFFLLKRWLYLTWKLLVLSIRKRWRTILLKVTNKNLIFEQLSGQPSCDWWLFV